MQNGIKKRFLEKIYKNKITGCWEWTAMKQKSGLPLSLMFTILQ